MAAPKVIFCLLILAFFSAQAITPGGSYSLFNASSATLTIQARTAARPDAPAYKLPSGFGDSGSGDKTKLVELRITYPNGRRIILDEGQLDRRMHGNGTWWIDDQGVTFISEKEANIRIHNFTHRNR